MWSQNYKEQRAHSCTWKNVVYNILVLRLLSRASEREREKKWASLDVFTWNRKVKHRDNKISLQHVQIKGDIFVCKVWELKRAFEGALIRLCGAQHKQTERLLSPYFSQESSFLQRKSVDVYHADRSVSWGCVKCWMCSLSGLACISAALLKHVQIIIQRQTNRLLTLV